MKKLLFLLLTIVFLGASYQSQAKSFTVCITMNTNEQILMTSTYIGGGMWSLSGLMKGPIGMNLDWTISGTANAYADTLYCKMSNPNPNDCNVSYDFLVWRAYQQPGDFQGYVEQWCPAGESPGGVVWVSCKMNQVGDGGTCDGINGCGQSPNQDPNHSPIYPGYVQTAQEASAVDQAMGMYFDLLRSNMPIFAISPNPATNTASLNYTVVENGKVSISVYNQIGQLVKVIVNENQAEGEYKFNWNLIDAKGQSVPRGNYLVRVESNGSVLTEMLSVEK